ncbi:MAG: hypothetical protein QGG88_12355 [Gammaproteobacteria bacterium]|jgi:sarcosine oxidase subunit gamma|nr:hypothetical protein [Gammaproteobacteria bacterium]
MTSALKQYFNLPQVFTGVVIDEVVASKMWQLEGIESIVSQVSELTGMSVPEPGCFTHSGDQYLVWQGRHRYFWLTQVASVNAAGLYATDQSHSKTQLRISGTKARALLARGLPVDIDAATFNVGDIRMTHINHIGVVVLRLPDRDDLPVFELWVMRGFAVSLMEFLTASAATL